MAADIPPEAMQAYARTARERARARQEQLDLRHEKAWALARRAAALLKQEFGATKVVVFGSLLYPQRFHERSDVDLAAWGLDERLYYRAVARLLDLEPGIEVDLIEMESARSSLQDLIEREGVLL